MTSADRQNPVVQAIGQLASGKRLGEDRAADAFSYLMQGEATPAQIAALLIGLRVQGETGEDIAGAVRAMRGVMIRVEVAGVKHLIDTCGTGGGTIRTFNISTAAAIVAVGAGAAVAKHGNRSFTSKCGSADVLEALGIELAIPPERAARQISTIGMAFLFAPSFHPAMKHVGAVRKEIGVPTIMNLVGPLSNPAGVRRQVLGVADSSRAPVLAEALRRLGAEHALVVHGVAGMDEIAPSGPTAVWEVRDGRVTSWTLDPADYGLEGHDLSALEGGEPRANAGRIRSLMSDGKIDSTGRAAVIINAAAALYVSGVAKNLAEGVERAAAVLEDGSAANALEQFVAAQGTRSAGAPASSTSE